MMVIKIDIKKLPIIVLSIGILAILLWTVFSNKEVGNVSPPKLHIHAEIQRDIHYKKDLKLDIYKPLNLTADKYPVIVFIHGGGWSQGDKSVIESYYRQYVLQELLNEGIAVVSIDYTLTDSTKHFPKPVADCKDAIRWIRKNAFKYHFDSRRIGLWGASAGGNLALLTAYSPPDSFPGDTTLLAYSSSVNFVIDNFGPVDLNQLLRTDVSAFQGNVFKLFNKEKYQRRRDKLYELTGLDIETEGQKVVEKCSLYSPIQYVSRTSVPTLILHGTADETVNLKQSEMLDKKLKEQGVSGSKFIAYKGLTHGFKNADEAQIAEITKSSIDFVQTQINQ